MSHPFSYTYITTAKDGGDCYLHHRIYNMETVDLEFFCNKIQPNIVVNEVSLNIESIVNDSTSDTIAHAVYMILYVIVWFDDRMGLQILLLDIEIIHALQKLSFAQYAC